MKIPTKEERTKTTPTTIRPFSIRAHMMKSPWRSNASMRSFVRKSRLSDHVEKCRGKNEERQEEFKAS